MLFSLRCSSDKKWLHESCRSDIGGCWNAARELLQNSNMKLYGRLAAHRYAAVCFTAATTTVAWCECWSLKDKLIYWNVEKIRQILYKRTNVRRNVEKIRQILYKRTNVRRNVEKIIQILYKRTNIGRNFDKIRQILYKPTNVRRNVEKIRQLLYKRTNVRRNVEKIRQILCKRTNVRRNFDKIRNTVQTN